MEYTTKSILFEDKQYRLINVSSADGKTNAVIKQIKQDAVEKDVALSKLKNSFNSTYELELNGVVRCLDFTSYENQPALLFAELPGKRLTDLTRNVQLSIRESLQIGIQTVRILSELHDRNIIYKNISPFSINVLEDGQVLLTDFTLASSFHMKMKSAEHPGNIEGQLSYISPEQTGRTNRFIDHRTDFYSLGVVLYEMLCGEVPHHSKDQLQMVHFILAREPEEFLRRQPNTPQILVEIIYKLLAKNAEDRYQTARGLIEDLEKCLLQYKESGDITSFKLGQQDFSEKLVLSEIVYGRDAEIKELVKCIDRLDLDQPEIYLVKGVLGIGKTSLVEELRKTIYSKGIQFFRGKYVEYGNNVPYFGLIEVINDYLDFLMQDDEDRIAGVKEVVLAAIGNNGRVLTEFIPKLSVILPDQPPITDLGPFENRLRFNTVIRSFFQSICLPDHPIIMFLDDLQWADSASLDLIKSLVIHSNIPHLMLVGTYRDNEVDELHPLKKTLDEIESENVNLVQIQLNPLNPNDIISILSDCLLRQSNELTELGKWVHKKTGGNPFFARQFINSIADHQLIELDRTNRSWTWDIDGIKKLKVTDNVVTLMADRIKKMDDVVRRCMEVAACVGNKVEFTLLHKILDISKDDLIAVVTQATRQDVLIPYQNNYLFYDDPIPSSNSWDFTFSHDRIRQALYDNLESDDKASIHLKIAKRLHKQLSSTTTQEDDLFDVVNNYNSAREHIIVNNDKKKVAKLNLQAGTLAKSRAAYELARKYFYQGITILGHNPWEKQYDLTLALYQGACVTSYSCGDDEGMLKSANIVIKQARVGLDKIQAYEVLIKSYEIKNEFQQALDIAKEATQSLGVSFPKYSKIQVAIALILTKIRSTRKDVIELTELPEIKDKNVHAAVRIFYNLFSLAYQGFPELYAALVLETVNQSLNKGVSKESAFSFSLYGVVISAAFNDYEGGLRYSDVSIGLLKRFKDKQYYPPVYAANHTHYPQRMHIRDIVPMLEQAYTFATESGDLFWASVHLAISSILSFWAGVPISELANRVKLQISELDQKGENVNKYRLKMILQVTENLLGRNENPIELKGDVYDGEEYMDHFKKYGNTAVLRFFHGSQVFLGYIFDSIDFAYQHLEEAEKYLKDTIVEYGAKVLVGYQSLVWLEMAESHLGRKRKDFIKKVKQNQKKYKIWSNLNEPNYAHRYHIVEGRLAELIGAGSVIDHYGYAIQLAKESNFVHEEALAWELSGKYLIKSGKPELATMYLEMAMKKYEEWGAIAKVGQMKSNYKEYFSKEHISDNKISSITKIRSMDVNSIVKATNAISGEIILKNYLEKLMDILIENAGAQKGILLLNQDEELSIVAIKNVDGVQKLHTDGIKAVGSGLLADSVIQYVSRLQQDLVVDNALENLLFNKDPYIKNNGIKSLICTPIFHQKKMLGLLYLENNLATGAFTEGRLELLRLLSGQIAISLYNALLYDDMDHQVKERTHQIEEERIKSDQLLLNILPEYTADELKRNGKTKARRFENVTVLFSDFVDFTQLSEVLKPEELIQQLDEIFTGFDHLMDKYDLEKIKTSGDSYMCVAGLPKADTTGALKMIQAGLEMLELCRNFRARNSGGRGRQLDIRIGIHTGPVVAGVVGLKKFAFDIWGDTVNTASRMESSSDSNRINISRNTYDLVKHRFKCSHRGRIDAKHKGEIDMYFVEDTL